MRVVNRKKQLALAVVGATAVLASGASFGQGSATNLVIEEVVVTAQKRTEEAQDVPISISTLSESDLERRGVSNAADLVGTIPNMGGFQPPGAKGNIGINMRGVSSGSPSNLSLDTSVGVYIDGVLIGKQVGSALDVAELERVEVLRGPQGTLYGRNSTGGAVNFVTRKPTGEFGGSVTGTVGDEGLWGVKANIHTDTLGTAGEGLGALAASLGYQTRERDAFYENRVPGGDDMDDLDREAYRLALRWDINNDLVVDYAYDHSELDEANAAQVPVGLTPLTASGFTRTAALQGYIQAGQAGLAGFGPLAAAATAVGGDPTFNRWLQSAQDMLAQFQNLGDGDRPNKVNADVPTSSTNESDGHSLTAAWNFDDMGVLGSVEFKSITGYREVEARNIGDLDGFDNTIAPGGAGALNDSALGAMYSMYAGQAAVPPAFQPAFLPLLRRGTDKLWQLIDQYGGAFFTQDAKFDYEQFSQELQMVGSTDSLQYALGLYYWDDEGSFDNYRLAATPVAPITSTAYDNDTDAYAFYTQVTWTPDILDQRLALTLGYRRTEEEKSITYRYQNDGGGPFAGGDPLASGVNLAYTGELSPASTYGDDFDQKFSNDSGSVTIAYQLGDNTNVFARWAQGYRAGGFNGEIYDSRFKEETMEQWELGVKSDVMPGLLRVNASIFQYQIDDLQVSQIEVDDQGLTTSFIGNAGEAERWGTEVEVQLLPTDNLLLALSYTHMGGEFDKYGDVCGSKECLPNPENDAHRAQSPDDAVSLVADWVFAQTDWAEFMAHVEVFWQDETYASALWTGNYGAAPNTQAVIYDPIVMKDRTLVNARIGIENVEVGCCGATLRASLWSRNLLDEDYNTFGINFGTLGPITEQYGEPRTFGVDVTYEF